MLESELLIVHLLIFPTMLLTFIYVYRMFRPLLHGFSSIMVLIYFCVKTLCIDIVFFTLFSYKVEMVISGVSVSVPCTNVYVCGNSRC